MRVPTRAATWIADRRVWGFVRSSDAHVYPNFQTQLTSVRKVMPELTLRAQVAGLIRTDIDWRDLFLLAQAAVLLRHSAGVEQSWRRMLVVALDGLSPASNRFLPAAGPFKANHISDTTDC
jgi:hypothetical protein